MNTKILIERNLPFNQKYIYLGIIRGSVESGQLTCCDNCGKLITNMVHVVNKETCKQFTIGMDCAETLVSANCLYNNGQQTDFSIDIFSYNQAARFVTELKKGCKLNNDGFYCRLTNTKGKAMEVFTSDLKKFFPQYLE